MHSACSRLFLLTLLLLTAAGCELLGGHEEPDPVTTGVFVANQGSFTDGNGSVSVYDPQAGIANAAAVTGLGSIVQSLRFHEGRLYVVANTGNRIDVYDPATLTRTGQVTGLLSPRYMAVAGEKAYVTNLYGAPGSFTGGRVAVLDLASQAKVKDIAVGDNPEGIVVVGRRAYVAHHGFGSGRTLSVIDTATDAVVDTIDVGCDGPRYLLADAEEEVYVFCTGQTLYDDQYNPIGETDGAVRVLDGATGEIIARFDVDGRLGTEGPGQDAYYAPEAEEAYVVLDGHTVLRFDTAANAEAGRLGPLAGAPIGAVAYDDVAGRLYVGHVPDYTTSGTVTVHDRAGAEVDRFTAGIAPTYIAFRRAE